MTGALWANALNAVREHTLLIETPEGRGTGFLLAPPDPHGVVGIAIALHVAERAVTWLQPIRISNAEQNKSVLLRPGTFSFHHNEANDLALIRIPASGLPLPTTALPRMEGQRLVPGAEIGWCGYPAVASKQTLCFFMWKRQRLAAGRVGVPGGRCSHQRRERWPRICLRGGYTRVTRRRRHRIHTEPSDRRGATWGELGTRHQPVRHPFQGARGQAYWRHWRRPCDVRAAIRQAGLSPTGAAARTK